MTNSELFVITGGPAAGKTTVLQELQRRRYRCIPEVARQVIQDQVQSGGDALPWGNRQRYTGLMLQGSIETFLVDGMAFVDRGIPDTLAYARLIDLADQSAIVHACEQYRYAPQVFLAPPWEEIYATDQERKQDFAEAIRTYELLRGVYEECGYEIVELPKVTPTERADFILGRINSPERR